MLGVNPENGMAMRLIMMALLEEKTKYLSYVTEGN